MKTLRLAGKLFFKNNSLFFTFILLIGYVNYHLCTYNVDIMDFGGFACLYSSLLLVPICFTYFLFLSYEIFYKSKNSYVEETVKSTKKGIISLYKNEFLIIVFLIIIVNFIVLVYNLRFYNSLRVEYGIDNENLQFLRYILYTIFSHFFLVLFLAIVIGLFAKIFFKRLWGYCVMTFFVFFANGFWEKFVIMSGSATNNPTYNYTYMELLFNVFPDKWTSNFLFGISNLSYKIEIKLFWICLFVSLIFIKLSFDESKIALRILGIIFSFISVVNLFLYCLPSSKLINSYSLAQGSFADMHYYSLVEQMEENGNFKITKYNLEMDISKKLKVKAILDIDNVDLDDYKLTLYHGFDISKVIDNNGTQLDFDRNGDYLLIKNDGNDMSQITIDYSGYSSEYYANEQGILLPGKFAYYPHSGYQLMFIEKYFQLADIYLDEPVEFTVSVNSSKEVFSNLDKLENGTFFGVTDGPTFVSGFIESHTYEGIELVYPYADIWGFNSEKNQEMIKAFVDEKDDYTDVKKVIIMPSSTNSRNMLYSDYMTVGESSSLLETYENGKVRVNARVIDLYYVYKDFTENREIYQSILSQELDLKERLEETGEDVKEINQIYTIFNQKLDLIGEEKLLELTKEFLFDKSDKRTSIEFLESVE